MPTSRTTSGVFLVGAYQEILGDMHNLFGVTTRRGTSASTASGNVVLEAVIKGDTVREALDYVEFDAEMLLHRMRVDVESRRPRRPHRARTVRAVAAVLRRRTPRV